MVISIKSSGSACYTKHVVCEVDSDDLVPMFDTSKCSQNMSHLNKENKFWSDTI